MTSFWFMVDETTPETRRDRLRSWAARTWERIGFMFGCSWWWGGFVVATNLIGAVISAVAGHPGPATAGVVIAVVMGGLIAWNRAWHPALPYGPVRWMDHRAGIPWDETPAPPSWHRCAAWTRGRHSASAPASPGDDYIERCRCGARRHEPLLGAQGPWRDRNSRKDSK